jgi:hypothetical protein
MPTVIPISGVAAGQPGSTIRAILAFTGLGAAGSPRRINDTNFSGIGAYLPAFAVVLVDATGTGISATVDATTDGGTTWRTMVSVTNGTTGLLLPLDTAGTFRITNAGGNIAVRFLIL